MISKVKAILDTIKTPQDLFELALCIAIVCLCAIFVAFCAFELFQYMFLRGGPCG